jgi:hypothetical protein
MEQKARTDEYINAMNSYIMDCCHENVDSPSEVLHHMRACKEPTQRTYLACMFITPWHRVISDSGCPLASEGSKGDSESADDRCSDKGSNQSGEPSVESASKKPLATPPVTATIPAAGTRTVAHTTTVTDAGLTPASTGGADTMSFKKRKAFAACLPISCCYVKASFPIRLIRC